MKIIKFSGNRMYLILDNENKPVEIFNGNRADAAYRVSEINHIMGAVSETDKVHLFQSSLPVYEYL